MHPLIAVRNGILRSNVCYFPSVLCVVCRNWRPSVVHREVARRESVRNEHQIGFGRASSPRKARGLCSQLVRPPPFFPSGLPLGRFLYCWRTMSCCGNIRPQLPDKIVSAVGGTRSVPITGDALQQHQQFLVSEQPAFHPGIITPFIPSTDASSFRPPNITTPPPLVHSTSHLNGTSHSPPPTASTMHSSIPPSSPQMGMFASSSSAVDPNGRLSPLRRPTPTYPASGSSHSPNLLSTYHSSAGRSSLAPIDEGKVSVSIDFGEASQSPTAALSKLTVVVQELPSLAW